MFIAMNRFSVGNWGMALITKNQAGAQHSLSPLMLPVEVAVMGASIDF
jgi:hypothetical protein